MKNFEYTRFRMPPGQFLQKEKWEAKSEAVGNEVKHLPPWQYNTTPTKIPLLQKTVTLLSWTTQIF